MTWRRRRRRGSRSRRMRKTTRGAARTTTGDRDMDLTFTEEQEMLRQTVRELCAKHSSPEIVRALERDSTGFSKQFWEQLVRTDLLGLTIPEEYGGAGQSALEGVVMYEEFGRALPAS